MMRISEVAAISGVTVRTLHYYDEIGLLKPTILPTNYRDYNEEHLKLLQQILFYRELGLSLQEMKDIIYSPNFNHLEKLNEHLEQLKQKQKYIEGLVQLVTKTIQAEKGEIQMTNEQKFQGFDFKNNLYEEEAKGKWGEEKVMSTNKNIATSPEFQKEMNEIFLEFAYHMDLEPTDEKVQEITNRWYDLLNKVGNYSLEAFSGLGGMYVEDERFKTNIDQVNVGLANYMKEAMEYYAIVNTK